MDEQDVVKRGYMTQCTSISEAASPSRLLESVLRKLTGHKLWYVLRSMSLRGRPRLEFYKDEKSAKDLTCLKGFIPLSDMRNVYVKDGESKKLLIECGDTAHVFKCSSMADAEEWLEALMKTAPEQIAGRNAASLGTGLKSKTWGSTPTLIEDSSTARFMVTVEQQPKLNFMGECELTVTEWDVHIKDVKTNQYIESWPLHLIRQYGHGDDHFTLEAGRRCTSGEGTFRFKTKRNQAAEIYHIVHTNSENWAIACTPPSTPPIPTSRGKRTTLHNQETQPPSTAHRRPKPIRSDSCPAPTSTYAALNPSTIHATGQYESITPKPTGQAKGNPLSGYMALQTHSQDRKAADDKHYMQTMK